MFYSEEQLHETFVMQTMLDDFAKVYLTFHAENSKKLEEYKSSDPLLLKAHLKKYPYLSKNTSKKSYSLIYKLFEYPEFARFNNHEFRKYLFTHLSKKIRGMFKHGQSGKTQISCEKISSDIQKNILTVAITKNTLLANIQWTTRFIKHMHEIYGEGADLSKKILVISSKKNDLKKNATHCKTLSQAWTEITDSGNAFKVIFVCANSTRIADVCDLLLKFTLPAFNPACLKDVVIHYDEAHNPKEGIPPNRSMVENMLIHGFVKEIIPITASYKPILDTENPIWLKSRIDQNKMNYVTDEIEDSKRKSDDEGYSSIADAKKIVVGAVNPAIYDNTIPVDLFEKHYPNENYEIKGSVNACPIGFCGDEELALNWGKQILDNRLTIHVDGANEPIFKADVGNTHTILTPCRTVITDMLMRYASEQIYHPVSIGLFRGKLNYRYRDLETGGMMSGEIEMGNDYAGSEFNDIFNKWLDQKNLKSRCHIIMAMYTPIGESNTFVHSEYGYVRSSIILPGCVVSPEQNYQFFLRCCFLLRRFPGLSKSTVSKCIVGPAKSIADAIEYERLNDAIVQELIDNPIDSDTETEHDDDDSILGNTPSINTTVAPRSIPVQFKIEDEDSEPVKEMRRIMRIPQRTREQKDEFMDSLLSAIDEQSIEVSDPNVPAIRLSDYRHSLHRFQCYREENDPNTYRLPEYYFTWHTKTPSFINGELLKGQCGVYSCLKKHKRDNNPHITNPNTFYMDFAF